MTLLSRQVSADAWPIVGPEGGSVRSLAYDPDDPNRMFLGTGSGSVFLSTDGGRHWSHSAQLGGPDYVLDHIVTVPNERGTIFISAWSTDDPKRGDLFRSRDGGSTWESLPSMHGRSVRALAFAGTAQGVLVAGALDGVYRSANLGASWEKISREGDVEIKNIQSVAVDPSDPKIIYAGTWHLLWKTKDGGLTWRKASHGMEYDSDIFSILVDVSNRHLVFASACSGIYRSDTGGQLFLKVHDIPDSARRTHVLRQNPKNPRIMFAGTTEGLWRTLDGGMSWTRVTSRSTVVNDVLIDPRHSNRVILATDRLGILISADGGRTFAPSNYGYSHRYVTAIVADRSDPSTFYVGLANDRESGGVFSFDRRRGNWQQMSNGLGGRDVVSLKHSAKGTLVAGTNQGLYQLEKNSRKWRTVETLADSPGPLGARVQSTKFAISDARVNDLDLRDRYWWAATSAGLFKSADEGKSWAGGPVWGLQDFITVKSLNSLLVAATTTAMVVSNDAGESWHRFVPPKAIRSLVLTPTGRIVMATRQGGFCSSDAGMTWQPMLNGLPEAEITSMLYDDEGARLLAAADGSVFESHDEGRSWKRGPDAGLAIRNVSAVAGRIVAATFDGIVIQPNPVP